MKLSEVHKKVQFGFSYAHDLEGEIIQFVEGGPATHMFLVVAGQIYETDSAWKKSKFSPIDKYDNMKVELYGIDSWTAENEVLLNNYCEKTKGEWYSYAACVVQALFFWANNRIKNKIDSLFDNSYFAKCDRLSVRGLYAATGNDCWLSDFSNPEEWRLAVNMRKGFTRYDGA